MFGIRLIKYIFFFLWNQSLCENQMCQDTEFAAGYVII